MKALSCIVLGMAMLITGCGPSSESKPQTTNPGSNPVSPEAKLSQEEASNYRLEWNRTTLLGDYERHGSRDSKWDDSAKHALEQFAQIRTGGQKVAPALLPELVEATKAAVASGCDDPLIKYLHARFVLQTQEHDSQQHVQAYQAVAEAMSRSQYAPIRKYYAAARMAEFSNQGSAAAMPEVFRWREQAKQFLTEVVKDKTTPSGEVHDACDRFFQIIPKHSKERYEVYLRLEPMLFRNWPAEPSLYLLKGQLYVDYAWEARGSGWGDSVTAKGWDGFEKRLAIAERALNEAWKLDPNDARIARHMLTVELGQGRGRERMEQWFERAMALNTNYYDACYAKLYYLEPKWYGSREDMFAFASECLCSEKWGGKVPLIVLDAHESAARSLDKDSWSEYWKRPEVWNDVKQSFDKFFRLNPQATDWHHNYALYAYRAEQWDELNRQLGLLGPVNYSYFGGKEQFDKMVQLARQHSTPAASASSSESAR